MKTPPIKIKHGLNEEADQFSLFLHHPFFPQHRVKIFQAFPQLKTLLEDCKNKDHEKLIIKKFIKEFRKKHFKEIQIISDKSKKILKEKSKKALTDLAGLMDYEWNDNRSGYTVMLTILPFSPFHGNTFYFSILGFINKKKQQNVLFVAIHEISHMVLFEILKKASLYKKIDKTSLYFLKEILAPVVMNQKPLVNLLKIKDYSGNPFLRHIFLKQKNKKIQITECFQKIYETERSKNKSFIQILKILISLTLSIKKELKEKQDIWNKYGNNIVYNSKALKKYSTPIKIIAPE